MKVVVVGGGFAGCGAAMAAAKAGATVTLIERTDMLLGCGLDAGIFRVKGRFTAAEELKAMGGGDIFEVLESLLVKLPPRPKGPYSDIYEYADIYEVTTSELRVKDLLERAGVKIHLKTRAMDVKKDGNRIDAVVLRGFGGTHDEIEKGDVFVDSSGTAGGVEFCRKYGKGCMMCMMRCPAFGDRISIATKAGAPELMRYREDGTPGALTSCVVLNKDTVDPEFRAELAEKGIIVKPLPNEAVDPKRATMLTNTNLPSGHGVDNVNNLTIIDIGHAIKLQGSVYFPLEKLRMIPEFKNARLISPLAGDWNAIRYVSMTLRDDALKVDGFTNLYCAGEKSGAQVGVTEAVVSGYLAGHNAARTALGKAPLVLPRSTAIGDFVAFVNEQMRKGKVKVGYSFQGGPYLKRMEELGFFTKDVNTIKARVEKAGVTGVFARKP